MAEPNNGDESPHAPRDWFDRIYAEFVLRDLFAKVVPGLVVILAFFSVGADKPEMVIREAFAAQWWVWILALGPAWIVGFAVQGVGELTGLIKYRRSGPRGETGYMRTYEDIREFAAKARPDDRRQHERIVVIKEACGNGAIALLTGLVLVGLDTIVGVRHVARTSDNMLLGGALLITALALLYMHRHHVSKEEWFEAVVSKKRSTGGPGNS